MPGLTNDSTALLASALFLLAALGAAELARRMRAPADVTRKGFHAALGSWAIAAIHLFESRSLAAGFFAGVAALSYLSFRFDLFASIEDDGPSLGSVFLPLSCAGLLALFPSGEGYITLAGILAAAWGDTTAAIVGRRFGSRRFRLFGHARTMEGTLALFMASSAAMALVLGFSGELDWHRSVAFALITGTLAASVEIASPYGTDNVTVPFGAAATLWVLVNASA